MWQRLEHQFDHDSWNQFVKKHGPLSGRFLQSWEWGEFQGAEKWVWEEKGVANVLRKNLRGFGRYAYCPRGPVVTNESLFPELVEGITKSLGTILFFRSDFPLNIPTHTFTKSINLQPAHTWMTQLTTSDDLLSSMHQKTRYNIKLAERHGVRIDFDTLNFDAVWPLFEGTSGRGKFRLHEKSYYKRMIDSLHGEDCRAHLVTALFEDKPIAANIMIDFAGVRTYLHGASSYEHRALMAPYLLHWVLIKDAIEQGMTHYDWWGVVGERQQAGGSRQQVVHSWAGISRFKRSFPGQEIEYPGTYDLVRKPLWYKVYQFARQLRRLV